ncbi:hypothetical protein B296_00032649, partial [Ensete ventricosum]
CCPSCSPGGRSRPPSTSLGVMTLADVKALQALDVMKSCHNFDSTISLESLGTIRERYSIPTEYILHAPAPEQRPYHPRRSGFSISVDALEARLRFPLHSVTGEYMVNMNLLHDLSKARGGRSDSVSPIAIAPSPATAPIVVDPALAPTHALQNQHYHMALIDRVHDVDRVITFLDDKVDGLRKEVQRLKDGVTPTRWLQSSNEPPKPSL